MPVVDLRCSDDDCGFTTEYYRNLSTWDDPLPICETCGKPTYQSLDRSRRTHWTVDPVVVFQAPDGTMRFPGDAHGTQAGMYQSQGYTRIEIRGALEMRRFEKFMNRNEFSQASRKAESQQRQREAMERETRSEVRRGLEQGFQIPELNKKGERTGRMTTVRLSERGRAIMAAAVRRNDNKPREAAKEAGFHCAVYTEDRSTRGENRFANGQRRRD